MTDIAVGVVVTARTPLPPVKAQQEVEQRMPDVGDGGCGVCGGDKGTRRRMSQVKCLVAADRAYPWS